MKNTLPYYTLDCSEDIRALIGRPYEQLDCWGIVVLFYQKIFNKNLNSYYSDRPKERADIGEIVNIGRSDFFEVDRPAFGDIILFNLYGIESHIGVCLDDENFLHTSLKTNCTIESLSRWKNMVAGYYRLKND